MKANELRIGNLLQGYLEIRTVVELHKDYYTDTEDTSTLYRDADGIELTEEWLLKFGFKRVDMMFENEPMLYWRKDDFIINDERNVILFNDKETMIKIHCEYVHQLQNLYFALTGEELEIK